MVGSTDDDYDDDADVCVLANGTSTSVMAVLLLNNICAVDTSVCFSLCMCVYTSEGQMCALI